MAVNKEDTKKTEENKDNKSGGPADTFNPSGAPDQVVDDVDPDHPAVDNDPRAKTSALQNQIDFNDPTLTGSEAVAKNLEEQGGIKVEKKSDK